MNNTKLKFISSKPKSQLSNLNTDKSLSYTSQSVINRKHRTRKLELDMVYNLPEDPNSLKVTKPIRAVKSKYEFNNITTDPVVVIQQKLKRGLINYGDIPDLKEIFDDKKLYQQFFHKRAANVSLHKKAKKFNINNLDEALNNPDEMLLVDAEDSFEKLLKEEKQVKDLNHWESKYISSKEPLKSSKEAMKYSTSKNDLEGISFMNKVRERLNQLTVRNRELDDFCKNSEIEMSIILMQNINLCKKNFKFDVFKRYKIEKPIEMLDQRNFKSLDISKIPNAKDKVLKFDEDVMKENNFYIPEKLNIYSNVDKYRAIIKERIKFERAQRKEYFALL